MEERKEDAEDRALAKRADDLNVPPVGPDDLIGNGQAEPGSSGVAGASGIGTIERLEDMWEVA
jgi:hypothetical protein